jgi:fatty-acid desaturase
MKNLKFILILFIPLHLIFVTSIFFIEFSLLNLIYFLIGYTLIGGIGGAVGLHRWASHRSVEIKNSIKPFVLYFSLLTCQGHPIWWASVHRGVHHRFSDTEKDEHSPIRGKLNSFVGWIFLHDLSKVNFKFSIDLMKDPMMLWTAKFYEIIIISSWILIFLIDFNLFFWGLIFPTIFWFHGDGLINTFCHSNYGYRNHETSDNSHNVPFLALLFWGNGWHNNHHFKSSSYDFGKSVSGKKREFDPCVLFLPLIKKSK